MPEMITTNEDKKDNKAGWTYLNERGETIEYNSHFYHPAAPATAPWQRTLNERRQQSKDPKTIARCQHASAFEHTHLAGVFEFIQHHCGEVIAKGNYLLSRDDIVAFCRDLGISNDLMLTRLFKLFSVGMGPDRWKNTIPIMDFMYVFQSVLHGEHKEKFPKVCFNILDVEHTGMLDRKKLNSLPKRNPKGITDLQLEALNHCWEEHEDTMATPQQMSLKEFKKCFAISADLVRGFMAKLLETACSLYASQDAPKPPASSEPIDLSNSFHDADSFLLGELEKMGGLTSPYAKRKKKKKGSKKKKADKSK